MKRVAPSTKVKSPVGMGRVRVFRLGGFVHVQSRDDFFVFLAFVNPI